MAQFFTTHMRRKFINNSTSKQKLISCYDKPITIEDDRQYKFYSELFEKREELMTEFQNINL